MKTYYGIRKFEEGGKLVCYQVKGYYGIVSFEKKGVGFFMESAELAESFQVYKATKNRSIYMVYRPILNKSTNEWETRTDIYESKKDLIEGIKDYFYSESGVVSFFNGTFDVSTVNELMNRIK